MIIVGLFEHSIGLEKMLMKLEANHIRREKIAAVPMELDPKNPYQLIHKKRDLYNKGIEAGIACAAFFSMLGACFGFILVWGPVFWGLILSVVGFFAGFGSVLLAKKIKKLPKKIPELTLLVQCADAQARAIMDEMWRGGALSVGKLEGQ